MATPENDLVTKLSHEIVVKCNLSNIVHVGPCGNQSDFQNFVIVMVGILVFTRTKWPIRPELIPVSVA